MKPAIPLLATALVLAMVGPSAHAQAAPATAQAVKPSQEASPARPNVDLVNRTFFLKNVSEPNEINEIFTSIRNILPASTRCFLVPSQGGILVRGTPDDIAMAQKIIDDLDRPRKTYRLTFTVTEVDGTKPVGVQHYAMVVASGQQTILKQGSRVPIVTGSIDENSKAQLNQISYIDVGMNFDATLIESGNGAVLRSTVERSSAAPGLSGVGPQDPVVRATSVKGEAHLAPGVPLMLGSADIPDSTRHLEIEVVMEKLP